MIEGRIRFAPYGVQRRFRDDLEMNERWLRFINSTWKFLDCSKTVEGWLRDSS